MKFCIIIISLPQYHNRSLEIIKAAAVDFLNKQGPREDEATAILTLLLSAFIKGGGGLSSLWTSFFLSLSSFQQEVCVTPQ